MNRFNLKMALASLIGMASIFTSSCSKEDENDNGKAEVWTYESKNLVTGYVFPEEMSIAQESDSISATVYLCVDVNGFVVGHRNIRSSTQFITMSDEEFAKRFAIFDSMATSYNDTSFDGRVRIIGNWALAYPIDSILITADIDYDPKHKAGSNLSDLINVRNNSYGKSILSNYKTSINGVDKLVSNLTKEELTLFGANYMGDYNTGYFTLPQNGNKKDCNLTVTYFFSNGQKLSATAKVRI